MTISNESILSSEYTVDDGRRDSCLSQIVTSNDGAPGMCSEFRYYIGTPGLQVAFIVLVLISSLLLYLWRRAKMKQPITEKEKRKEGFLNRAGKDYGYAGSERGYIDTWRHLEFPGLIPPHGVQQRTEGQIVYLDYAGAALPTKSQLEESMLSTHILANPHSSGPAASLTLRLIEEARKIVSDHFNCAPGRLSSLDNVPEEMIDNFQAHPGYEIVFTTGATEALKIVSERFPWTRCSHCNKSSSLIYPHNSHTSVLGMRTPAVAKGASFQCVPMKEMECSAQDQLERWEATTGAIKSCECVHHNLIVLNTECNFTGNRLKSKELLQLCRANPRWGSMLDVAKAAATSPVDLKKLDPDFACMSFYKLFGAPTGLGCLFVRRSATSVLMQQHQNQYFGGGSVDIVLPRLDYHVARQAASSLASLSNGTVDYRGIASLVKSFKEFQKLSGIRCIQKHASCLANEFARRLGSLRHANGNPVATIYGDKNDVSGPIVSFNVIRADDSFVGYNEVSKLAELNDPPIQLRTGCFCNPGACQEALDLTDEDIRRNYTENGHICGDHIDVINSRPTGAIRVSFGKDSLWEDLDTMLEFLEHSFVQLSSNVSTGTTSGGPHPIAAEVSELYIFPIKSCAAQEVDEWVVDKQSGRFRFDREFALVDSSGTVMRLQKYPKMSQIKPFIDLDTMTMQVSAPGCESLTMMLTNPEFEDSASANVKVCGDECGGRLWGSCVTMEWFSEFLGVECWLARFDELRVHNRDAKNGRPLRAAFANEEAILLVSNDAVDRLNTVLKGQGKMPIQTKQFRPNMVVRASNGDGGLCEDSWRYITHSMSNLSLVATGECARCSMVDIDPKTGERSGSTLRALATYRRRQGRITFGIFLRLKSCGKSTIITRGDSLNCF